MLPEPPFEMTIALFNASAPSPKTVAFEARSLHQRTLASWSRKQAWCRGALRKSSSWALKSPA